VTINQSSRNAAINWHSFNIGLGKKDSASTGLNRVTGDINASQIEACWRRTAEYP
jgi:hypothetical protein